MSSFVNKRERVFYDGGDTPLNRCRVEGRMKTYLSCTDTRAWELEDEPRRQHILDLLNNAGGNRPIGQVVPIDIIINTIVANKLASFQKKLDCYLQLELTPAQKEQVSICLQAIGGDSKDGEERDSEFETEEETEIVGDGGGAVGEGVNVGGAVAITGAVEVGGAANVGGVADIGNGSAGSTVCICSVKCAAKRAYLMEIALNEGKKVCDYSCPMKVDSEDDLGGELGGLPKSELIEMIIAKDSEIIALNNKIAAMEMELREKTGLAVEAVRKLENLNNTLLSKEDLLRELSNSQELIKTLRNEQPAITAPSTENAGEDVNVNVDDPKVDLSQSQELPELGKDKPVITGISRASGPSEKQRNADTDNSIACSSTGTQCELFPPESMQPDNAVQKRDRPEKSTRLSTEYRDTLCSCCCGKIVPSKDMGVGDDVASMQTDVQELMAELAKLQTENDALKKELNNSQKVSKNAQTGADDNMEERSEQLDTTGVERDRLREHLDKVSNLEEKLMKYKVRAQEADKMEVELEELRLGSDPRELKEQIKALQDSLKKTEYIQCERDSLRMKLKEVNELEARIEQLSLIEAEFNDLLMKTKSLDRIKIERCMYKNKYEEESEKVTDLMSQIEEMDMHNQRLSIQIHEMHLQERQSESDVAKLASEIEEKDNALIESQTQLKNLRHEIDLIVQGYEDSYRQSESDVAKLASEIEEKDNALIESQTQLKNLRHEIDLIVQGYEDSHRQSESDVAKLASEIEEKDNALIESQTQLKNLRHEIDLMVHGYEDSHMRMARALSELREEIDMKNEEILTCNEQLAYLDSMKEELLDLQNNLCRTITCFEAEKVAKEQEFEDRLQESENKCLRILCETEDENRQHEQEVNALKQDLENICYDGHMDTLFDQATVYLNKVLAEVENLRTEKEQLSVKVSCNEREINDLQNKLISLEMEKSVPAVVNNPLLSETGTITDENTELAKKETEIRDLIAEIAKLKNQLAQLQAQLDAFDAKSEVKPDPAVLAMQAELEHENGLLKEMISELQEQVRDLEERLANESARQTQQNLQAQTEVAECLEIIRSLEDQLKMFKERAEERAEQAESERSSTVSCSFKALLRVVPRDTSSGLPGGLVSDQARSAGSVSSYQPEPPVAAKLVITPPPSPPPPPIVAVESQKTVSSVTSSATCKVSSISQPPVLPVAIEPVPITPVAIEPVPITPVAIEPVPITPVAIEPVPITPVAIEPDPITPVAIEPVAITPVAIEPVAITPVAIEPVAKTPVAIEPVAKTPVAIDPVPINPDVNSIHSTASTVTETTNDANTSHATIVSNVLDELNISNASNASNVSRASDVSRASAVSDVSDVSNASTATTAARQSIISTPASPQSGPNPEQTTKSISETKPQSPKFACADLPKLDTDDEVTMLRARVAELEEQLKELMAKSSENLENLKQQYERDLANMLANHNESVARLQQMHEEAMAEAQKEFDREKSLTHTNTGSVDIPPKPCRCPHPNPRKVGTTPSMVKLLDKLIADGMENLSTEELTILHKRTCKARALLTEKEKESQMTDEEKLIKRIKKLEDDLVEKQKAAQEKMRHLEGAMKEERCKLTQMKIALEKERRKSYDLQEQIDKSECATMSKCQAKQAELNRAQAAYPRSGRRCCKCVEQPRISGGGTSHPVTDSVGPAKEGAVSWKHAHTFVSSCVSHTLQRHTSSDPSLSTDFEGQQKR